jgi:hypothetical protein
MGPMSAEVPRTYFSAKFRRNVGKTLLQIKRQGVADKAVIAKSVFIPKEPEPEVNDTVVWPAGFRGDFDVFGWSGSR